MIEEVMTNGVDNGDLSSRPPEFLEKARQFEMKARQTHLRNGQSDQNVGHSEDCLHGSFSSLRQQNAVLRADVSTLREENGRLLGQLRRLEVDSAAEAMAAEAPSNPAPTAREHAEGRLRSALTRKGTTSSELRQAIAAVESLVDEAKRELERMTLRERRAAYEALYTAIDYKGTGDEEQLEEAIEKARLADVADSDILKGEERLRELRALTPEQKAAKLAQERERAQKKEAYHLIKKNDPQAIQALIDSLDETVRWQQWRDFAGRSLWKCAVDLRADKVQEYLAPILGQKMPEGSGKRGSTQCLEKKMSADFTSKPRLSGEWTRSVTPQSPASRPSLGTPRGREALEGFSLTAEPPQEPSAEPDCTSPEGAVPVENHALWSLSSDPATSEGMSPSPTRRSEIGDGEHGDLRAKALRAVAQDDIDVLEEILDVVHKDVWSKWENKAGKDLLTLSQERGSSLAYSMLARNLGMLKEVFRESYEEREAVWVFLDGEVQPRRATVLEDTSMEADEVLVEFWDGDDPAAKVDRCMVRKTG